MDELHNQVEPDLNPEGGSLDFFTSLMIRVATSRNYNDLRFINNPWRHFESTDTHHATLKALEANRIIAYRFHSPEPKTLHIDFFVKNRYLLEKLKAEFNQKYSDRPIGPTEGPGLNNLIYYNQSSGDISVNGRRSKLKQGTTYKNRAIFNLLLRHTPNPAPREEALKILKLTSKTRYSDSERTYGINLAIDNLRDALKVDSGVISLRNDGIHLNASVVRVEQLPEDFRFTD